MSDQRAGTRRPGAIVWHEAGTSDLDRTTTFYEELLGWKHRDSEGLNGVYRHFSAGDIDVAGAYVFGPQLAGTPPHWMQYVSMEDVDSAAEAIKEAGGEVKMGPKDIPNVGRMVVCRDPQGATIALFRDLKGDAPALAPPYPIGVFCWETLITTDVPGAVEFYTEVVGWKTGTYENHPTFQISDDPMGGIADLGPAPPGTPSHWLSHVVIDHLADARDRASRLGAKILMPEIVVPKTGKMAFIKDPLGAVLSLFEPEPRR